LRWCDIVAQRGAAKRLISEGHRTWIVGCHRICPVACQALTFPRPRQPAARIKWRRAPRGSGLGVTRLSTGLRQLPCRSQAGYHSHTRVSLSLSRHPGCLSSRLGCPHHHRGGLPHRRGAWPFSSSPLDLCSPDPILSKRTPLDEQTVAYTRAGHHRHHLAGCHSRHYAGRLRLGPGGQRRAGCHCLSSVGPHS